MRSDCVNENKLVEHAISILKRKPKTLYIDLADIPFDEYLEYHLCPDLIDRVKQLQEENVELRKAQEWVSVEDELPPEKYIQKVLMPDKSETLGYCLVCELDGGLHGTQTYIEWHVAKYDHRHIPGFYGCAEEDEEPTHWQPPEQP